MHQFLQSRKVATAAFVTLLGYGLGLLLLWLAKPSIAAENALMENLQAGCLAIACILYLPCLIRPVPSIGRFACWSLFLVMLSMFLREVNVESLSVPSSVVWMGSGMGRNLILGTAFVATLVALARRPNESIGQLFEYAFSRIGALLFAGGFLYVSSLPFDKGALGLPYGFNQFCEEAVECGATLMFLAAAGINLFQYVVALRTNPAQQPTPIPSTRIAA
jgi:hypothetical protein